MIKLESLSTMSHSQGTAVTFAYLATQPEHAREKVDLTIFCSTVLLFLWEVFIKKFLENRFIMLHFVLFLE